MKYIDMSFHGPRLFYCQQHRYKGYNYTSQSKTRIRKLSSKTNKLTALLAVQNRILNRILPE